MNDKQLKSILGENKKWEHSVRDTDKDGVINAIDCEPLNPRKQGILHNIKSRVKEYSDAGRQKRAAERQIRSKSRAAYYQEKEKQDIRVVQEKAKVEADRKIKYHKRGGLAGQVGRGFKSVVSDVKRVASPPRAASTRKGKRKGKRRASRKRSSSPKQTSSPPKNYDFVSGGGFI